MTNSNARTWALDHILGDLNASATYFERRSTETRASDDAWDNGLSVGYEIAAEHIRRILDSPLMDYVREDLLEKEG